MSAPTIVKKHPRSACQRLIQRHFRQVIQRPQEQQDRLCDLFAITFLPGNRCRSFLTQPRQQPLGTATMVCLSYGTDAQGRRTMPIRGVRAEVGADGFVSYGNNGTGAFLHDAARRPSTRSLHQPLNPARNPSLMTLSQQMDLACQRSLNRLPWLPSVPMLPQIWLAFPMNAPPAFEATPALRELAAVELEQPLDQLGSNGEQLLLQYLRDLWSRQLMHPGDPLNETGSLLVNAEYCTQAHRALRVYEDFSVSLLGMPTWNPAREFAPLILPNPAAQVLEQFEIRDLNQPVTDDQLADLELAIRQAIGTSIPLTQEEIFDAITNQHLPLRSWSAVISHLRSRLNAEIGECTTDDDLLHAAANPDEPLIASGACRVQVLRRYAADDHVAFTFPSDDLGRRAQVNLHVTTWRAPGAVKC